MARQTKQSRKSLPQKPSVSATSDPSPLLLAAELKSDEVAAILERYGIQAIKEADTNLQSMAGDPNCRRPLADILPTPARIDWAKTADPDQALNHWERWLASGLSRSALLEYLRSSPRMLDLLCTIFGNSDALAFTLIRDPTLVHWLAEQNASFQPPAHRLAWSRALQATSGRRLDDRIEVGCARRFRRREMLRIGVRDLFRLASVEETTARFRIWRPF